MKIIKFQKWTRKTVNVHARGFTQTINHHYITIAIFGFHWRALDWMEYINQISKDDSQYSETQKIK